MGHGAAPRGTARQRGSASPRGVDEASHESDPSSEAGSTGEAVGSAGGDAAALLPEDELGIAGARGVAEARFREALGHFATGVTVVTALEGKEPVGFTCQAFASLSLEPPLVLLAPSRASTSWPRIRRSGRICVNILADHQEALCRDFAVSGADKFRGVGWRPAPNGAPLIDGVLAWVAGSIAEVRDGGDHYIALVSVEDVGVGSGSPLIFYRGGFGRLAP
jgi:3-hydroxy-9,10-secoandrosta-1,3,5(10)-triene-9,17-dione monooxygenase reductase component